MATSAWRRSRAACASAGEVACSCDIKPQIKKTKPARACHTWCRNGPRRYGCQKHKHTERLAKESSADHGNLTRTVASASRPSCCNTWSTVPGWLHTQTATGCAYTVPIPPISFTKNDNVRILLPSMVAICGDFAAAPDKEPSLGRPQLCLRPNAALENARMAPTLLQTTYIGFQVLELVQGRKSSYTSARDGAPEHCRQDRSTSHFSHTDVWTHILPVRIRCMKTTFALTVVRAGSTLVQSVIQYMPMSPMTRHPRRVHCTVQQSLSSHGTTHL